MHDDISIMCNSLRRSNEEGKAVAESEGVILVVNKINKSNQVSYNRCPRPEQ